MTVSGFNQSRLWSSIGLLALMLLFTPSLSLARTSPLQSRLQGFWVSVDGTPPNLKFVPTGPRTGQVVVGSGGVVDYHYYRLIGKNTVRIWDGKGIYRLRIRGNRLHMNKRGSTPARVYVKRPAAAIPSYKGRKR